MINSDLECPCQLDAVTGADFENSLYVFGQSEKRCRVQCIIMRVINATTVNILQMGIIFVSSISQFLC